MLEFYHFMFVWAFVSFLLSYIAFSIVKTDSEEVQYFPFEVKVFTSLLVTLGAAVAAGVTWLIAYLLF